MKKSVLHVGGHADGEYRDIELTEMADGGWQLSPGYTLREVPKVSIAAFDPKRMDITTDSTIRIMETHYVRDSIHCGDLKIDVYIDYKLQVNTDAALINALINGYRKPKGE
jgi:hypothetical protein